MGLYDSFYDEDSTCPKCHTRIKNDWQTKHLHRLLEYWHKGDWVQYRKLEAIPEERKRKYTRGHFAPLLRTSKKYLSDAPLLFNGKVPVHTSCEKCEAWLVAYAKVLDGRFVGIVGIEADRKEKEFVLIKPKTTAKTLREDFNRKLSQLQASCNHKKTQWTDFQWAPAHFAGQARVCLRCEKILERRNGWEASQPQRGQRKRNRPPPNGSASGSQATRNMDLKPRYPRIHVSLVMPGIGDTDFHRVAGTPIPMKAGSQVGPMKVESAEDTASKIASLTEHPVAELYTNPSLAELARRYYEDVEAFEENILRTARPSPSAEATQ